MIRINTLPTTPIAVPVYHPTGKLISITPQWFPGENPTLHFIELEPTVDSVDFDHTKLTPEGVKIAQDPRQGALLGLIAVPNSTIRAAADNGQARLHIIISDHKYSTTAIPNSQEETENSMIVVGVYEGNPSVTGL